MQRPYYFIFLLLFMIVSISSAADLYQQGVELMKENKYSEATTVFEQYLATDSTNAKAYYNLGLAYGNLDIKPKALAAWLRAVALNPNFEQAHFNLGLLYIQPNAYHTSEATTEFLTVIRINPKNSKAYYHLAIGYHRLGMYPQALQQLDTALKLKPDLTSALELKLLVYQSMQNYPAAIQIGESFYQKNTTDKYRLVLFNLYMLYGGELRSQHQYESAVSQFYSAQKLEPNHPQVQYELALTNAALGRTQNAETLFEYVLSKDPTSPSLLNNVANFYADNGIKLDRATLLIDSALRLNSSEDDMQALVYRDSKGWIEFKKGNYQSAYSIYSTVLEKLIAPYQPEPGLKESDLQAFLVTQPNYNLFPVVIQVRYHLALAAWQLDKKDESRQILDQIVGLATNDPAALEWIQKAKDWIGNK
jgi:tetratricopeptide (TPR) repeat protein